ncbi:MAG: D-2-hydroxyacid dehydrogenase [Candidatus Marinimicrobia bacterium]|nr:D-2-hydroxyacid dehydrogenase [Candidatus Neomarinimicrobiota bacterium]MCF6267011.1 D-2-hydroxyacid dehydrogenase [Desulfuromusa sp.]
MKIVVLDGYTLNPGDLDWASLKELGTCVIHPRTSIEQIVDSARDAEIILTNKTVISADTLALLPKLQYIGVLATGVNIIDLESAKQRHIVVTNVPGYSTGSVVQMVFALLLEMTQQVGHHAWMVRQGEWVRCPDFSFRDRPLTELTGKTLGVVGYGKIGQQVAQIAKAFGMQVLIQTAHPEKYQQKTEFAFVDIDRLFSDSDVISLNCPLTEETENLVNTARLARVKQGALLINTGRGQLINEEAVVEALEDGYLGGYATDVLSQEPPAEDNPLLSAPNCFITPHIAWATVEARQRLLEIVVENIVAFQKGNPQNRVA